MIKKTECYVAVCDVCEQLVDDGAEIVAHYDTEADAKEYALMDEDYGGSDCQEIEGKLCCQNCWAFDDDGEKSVVREAK